MPKFTEKELRFIKNPPKDIKANKPKDNVLEIMKKRSFLKDTKGKFLEGPKEMFWRVAASIALEDEKYKKANAGKINEIEQTAREFYSLMSENRFLPGARVLYEAGNYIDGTGQLASCFVLPIEDNLDQIFETMKEAAIVQKNNGGTGFNFSHIRPKRDSVGGTPNVAAGPVHFIRSYSQSFYHILQGKKRGGGNMAILNIDHPDIIEFINLKGAESHISNFNISVGITDKFMEAVKNDKDYELINPRNNEPVKKLRAREVFDLICRKAWECADPGLFFLDTAQKANPNKNLGVIEATNPCGEEPLRSYESCNLGSIVLPTHIKAAKEKGEKGKKEIDWDSMRESIHSAVHFLDNMIDLSKYPLKKIEDEVTKTRKLGLGVVGLGTLFYELEVGYNTQEAIDLTRKLVRFLEEESTKASEELAKLRGTFPSFKGSEWEKKGRKVRNSTMTSIAPTGTLSLLANTSSGIEPIFSLVYRYRGFYQDDAQDSHKQLLYVNEQFQEYAKKHGFYSEKLMEKIADNKGTLHGIDEVPDNAKEIFVTTHDIEPLSHVAIQAASQEHIDAAVSKTINMSEDATVEDVRKAYVSAWEQGCKGITIYRDNSKQMQVVEMDSKKENKSDEDKENQGIKQEIETLSEAETEEFQLTQNAIQVLEKRALKKDDNGNVIETPDELWQRIARYVAGAEIKYDGRKARKYEKLFYEMMAKGEFYSGGTLIYAGLGPDAVMSKCLVLPIDDSIDSIFGALNKNIQMLRRGVGTGFNFSKIRSTYAKVATTGENAAGPITYLKMFNRAQDTITGRGGRGLGSMAILNVDHPNIEDFIESKDNFSDLNHYNISVGISNKFMKAVKSDKDWDLVDPHSGKVCKTLPARELFEKIAKHAWVSGDPGMFFIDTAEKGNTTPDLGTMDGTNPCGEQPLIPYETCNLGNIDVSKFVKGFPYAENYEMTELSLDRKMALVDWDHLAEVIDLSIRFLDNIIDINNYPIEEIEKMTFLTRNIGLGIMGFADFLIKLGISYNSEDALQAARKLMKFVQEKSHESSEALGAEKGDFPEFKNSVWYTKRDKKHMRNTRVTTIAPTGSISIISNCNPGIEPVFALGYRRKNSMGGADQEIIEHLFEIVSKKRGFYSEELIKEIADGKHLKELQEKYAIPADVVEVFPTTHEIDPSQHVKLQAAFQEFIDSAVSKTINLSKSSTWRDIAKVYELAYDLGCKGITVFRDGSKDPALQVGTQEKKAGEKSTQEDSQKDATRMVVTPRERPEVARGYTYAINTNQGKLFITINEDEKGPFEVFLQGVGKSGSFTSSFIEAIGRLISMLLRSGISMEDVIGQLQGIRAGQPTMNPGGVFVYSVPDAVAKVMKKYLSEKREQLKMFSNGDQASTGVVLQSTEVTEKIEEREQKEEQVKAEIKEEAKESKYSANNTTGDLLECPECGGDLEYAEGCILCRSCGFSKCG